MKEKSQVLVRYGASMLTSTLVQGARLHLSSEMFARRPQLNCDCVSGPQDWKVVRADFQEHARGHFVVTCSRSLFHGLRFGYRSSRFCFTEELWTSTHHGLTTSAVSSFVARGRHCHTDQFGTAHSPVAWSKTATNLVRMGTLGRGDQSTGDRVSWRLNEGRTRG